MELLKIIKNSQDEVIYNDYILGIDQSKLDNIRLVNNNKNKTYIEILEFLDSKNLRTNSLDINKEIDRIILLDTDNIPLLKDKKDELDIINKSFVTLKNL